MIVPKREKNKRPNVVIGVVIAVVVIAVTGGMAIAKIGSFQSISDDLGTDVQEIDARDDALHGGGFKKAVAAIVPMVGAMAVAGYGYFQSNNLKTKKERKFRVINPDDIPNRDSQPNIASIFIKYQSLIKQHPNTKFKLIVLLRHGEGLHNEAKRVDPIGYARDSTDLKYKDGPLTQTGVDQVKRVRPEMKCLAPHIELAVLSPMNRAIETATHAFLPLIPRQCPVVVLEYTRECVNHHSCDSRDSLSDKKEKWKQYDFDWKGFESDEDDQWDGVNDESWNAVKKRSARMMDFIWENDANVVVYSGHCQFIMSLMEVIEGMPPMYTPKQAQYLPIIVAEVEK